MLFDFRDNGIPVSRDTGLIIQEFLQFNLCVHQRKDGLHITALRVNQVIRRVGQLQVAAGTELILVGSGRKDALRHFDIISTLRTLG